MGCVLAKPSMNSPPSSLEKMKVQNGYVGSGGGRRTIGKEPTRISDRIARQEELVHPTVVLSSDVGGSGRRLLTREDEKVANSRSSSGVGGNVSRRIQSKRPSGGIDEMVDGWPRWLTDNVPREALVGLIPKSAEAYDKLDKVGQGTYSNVYKARDRETGKIVALKKVRFDTSDAESVKFMAREIMILQKLNHPNVVKLEGLATSRMQYSLYLVFDFMQSDLARVISRPDERLTEPQVKCYMQQLLAGLQHCHERGILHRDIKGSNLLIDKNGMLKIGDFGLANYFNPNQKRPLTCRVVTLWYRAPELLLGATDYGVGIDLWSAGCLLAEMFAGRPIMPGRTEVEQLHRIFKLCGSPSEDYWKKLKLSTSFRQPQPYKPSIQEAFKEFPSSSLGLLSTLLALDPVYRGSASSALQNEFFSTSPLACDLSGLPVIYKEEDDTTVVPYVRRKSKKHKWSRKRHSEQRPKDQVVENQKGDSGSFKEEKKSGEANSSQETGSSTGSASFSKPVKRENSGSTQFLSPIIQPHFLKKSAPRTEGHPLARKNIKNLPPPLLPISKLNKGGNKEDEKVFRFGLSQRSNSTSDFRKLDEARLQKYYSVLED
ncbi:probable serine/threonine-protein kinase At1g54610 [Aristolochia californica]|uniref:probable serine/threonine-protein kinase At1g54610 n=1 Tax=Aristolochia californica TaxID=171875 RepID=UPI0035E0CE33